MNQSSRIISAITIFIITWICIFEFVECQRRPFQQNQPQMQGQQGGDSFFPGNPSANRPTTTTPRACDSIICTAEYNPLCARRNAETRTFNNRCLLNRENQCADSNQQWQATRLGICAPVLQTS